MSRFAVKKLYRREEGLAAFIVVAVLMLVISLVVMSFARIVRNEQRQTLDRQLSSRAFYAAESGINIANKELDKPTSVYAANGKEECASDAEIGGPAAYQIDSASTNKTEVTCLTVDNKPKTLEYSDIAPGATQTVPINTEGEPIDNLRISWQDKNAGSTVVYTGCDPTRRFLPLSTWNGAGGCNAPLLRVDIVEVSGAMSRDSLSSNVATFYFYPDDGGGVPAENVDGARRLNQGKIVAAACDDTPPAPNPKDCNAWINGFTGTNYYLRVTSYYKSAKLTISSSNADARFTGAQVVIDSTGRAQDIVRRLQVRRAVGSNDDAPGFAIEAADGLCKRLLVIPGPGGSVSVGGAGLPPADIAAGGICSIN